MNHSARFWKLVSRTIPDFVERRRLLRKSIL
jgi:predicted metal-dependent hydrolase